MPRGWFRTKYKIGDRHNKLTIIGDRVAKEQNGKKIYFYPCRCECGKEVLVWTGRFSDKNTISCGCHRNSLGYARFYKHGQNKTKLHRVWCAMKERCINPNRHNSNRYVGRGITVCEEWKKDFATFYAWAMTNGYREGLQIDRIDNDGNYSPDNCQWVTCLENNRNRSPRKETKDGYQVIAR